jgi:hypothetical protein
MVSGARSYRQIHTLIDRRLGLLNAAFPGAALRRAPAYTSVRGILQGLDEAELEQAFRRHAEGLDHTCGASPSRFVAIDGKTLRGSFDAFADRKAAHLLRTHAGTSESGLIEGIPGGVFGRHLIGWLTKHASDNASKRCAGNSMNAVCA